MRMQACNQAPTHQLPQRAGSVGRVFKVAAAQAGHEGLQQARFIKNLLCPLAATLGAFVDWGCG